MKCLLSALILIFLLPCIFCFFNSSSKEGTEIETRRRKAKRCDLVDFVGYNRPQRCCLKQPGSWEYTDLVAAICNNGVLFDDTYFYEYKFNRLLTHANHFSVEFDKKKQIPKTFAEVACVTSCMATRIGLIDRNHGFKPQVLEVLLATFAPLAWHPIIDDGIKACKPYLDTIIHVNVTYYAKHKPPQQCLVSPLLYVQCVHTYLIGRCPPSLQVANPSERCMDEIAGIDQCSAMFNLPPLFPTSESNSVSDEH